MKAKIENGRIVLPRELIHSLHLPENGECEVVPTPTGFTVQPPVPPPGGTRASGEYPPPPGLLTFLNAPPTIVSWDELGDIDDPDVD